MSSSRPGGAGVTWLARSISSSVVSPIARHDDHDLVAGPFGGDDALGYALDALRVGYRGTTVFLHDKGHLDAPLLPGIRRRTAAESIRAPAARPIFKWPGRAKLTRRKRHTSSRRRPSKARPRVTSSAYSRSPPTGSPLAGRVTRMPIGLTSRAR